MVFADPQLEEAGTGLALGLIAVQDAWEFQFADEAEVVVGKKTAAPMAELTTTALDALDAEREEASAMQAEPPAGEGLELADIEILQSRDEPPAPQTGDLPQPAEDAAPSASDAYEFDADLQAIFAMYKGFVPPEVTPQSRMTEPEARALLQHEAENFAKAVRAMLTRQLTDDQFSALVSFAYNVGEANFRRSSVLKAANAGDDAAVARRLGLWVKAGGKAWPGLVRRRAAEAALYLSRVEGPRGAVEVPRGKPMRHSTTGMAAGISAAAGTAAALAGSLRQIADALSGPYVTILLVLGILLAFGWILRERWLKSVDEGV